MDNIEKRVNRGTHLASKELNDFESAGGMFYKRLYHPNKIAMVEQKEKLGTEHYTPWVLGRVIEDIIDVGGIAYCHVSESNLFFRKKDYEAYINFGKIRTKNSLSKFGFTI